MLSDLVGLVNAEDREEAAEPPFCDKMTQQLKEVMLVAFKKRKNNDRRYIFIILIILITEVLGTGNFDTCMYT